MPDHGRHISNPLTIIAIFAGVAEIASTVALRGMPPELQSVFIWFVMGFPLLLVILFFTTLLWKPRVLYAPSDYREDKTFEIMMAGASRGLDEVEQRLNEARTEIVSAALAQIGNARDEDRHALERKIEEGINRVRQEVEIARGAVDDALPVTHKPALDPLAANARRHIRRVFGDKRSPVSEGTIIKDLVSIGFEVPVVVDALDDMIATGELSLGVKHDGVRFYVRHRAQADSGPT